MTEEMQAWATVAAVLVALTLGLVSWLESRRERSQRNRENTWAQARRISAFLTTDRTPSTQVPVNAVYMERINVLNASDEPVWSVSVFFQARDWHNFPLPSPWLIPVLPPNKTLTLDGQMRGYHDPLPARMTFQDNTGLWWERGTDGTLTRLAGEPERMPRLGDSDYRE